MNMHNFHTRTKHLLENVKYKKTIEPKIASYVITLHAWTDNDVETWENINRYFKTIKKIRYRSNLLIIEHRKCCGDKQVVTVVTFRKGIVSTVTTFKGEFELSYSKATKSMYLIKSGNALVAFEPYIHPDKINWVETVVTPVALHGWGGKLYID